MARINRYSRRTPYEGSLYELPIELIAKTLDFTQKRYDQNKEIANEIQDFTIPSLPQDRARANELQKQYSSQVDAIVKQYSGDYSKASNALKDLTRKVKKDFNPGGEAAAISGNYTNYNTWLKNSQDLVEKGKALGEDFNLANSYHMKNYQGIGQFDPVKGQYNVFNPETLSEYADMEQNIQKSFSTFKPEKRTVGTTSFVNGKIVQNLSEREGISQNRLKPSFESVLNTDPKVTTYMSQRAKYLGYSPKEAQDYINNFAAQRAHDLAYENSSDIEKATRDPMSLLYARAKIAADAKKKEQAEQQSQWAIESSTGLPYRKQSNINPNNWRASVSISIPNSDAPQGFVSSTGLGGPTPNVIGTEYNGKPLKEVLFTSKFQEKTNIDPILAKAVWSQLSSKNARSYVDNYGQKGKEAWTEQFDKEFLTAYQQHEKDHVFVAPATWDIPQSQARAGIVKDIAGKLLTPEDVMVMPFGSNSITTAKEADLKPEDLTYKIGDKETFTNDVKIAVPGPGVGGTGHLVATKKGKFIFIDNHENRNEYNAPLNHAAKNLFFEGKEITDAPITIGTNQQGRSVSAYIGRTIVSGSDGSTHEILYGIPYQQDTEGNPILDKSGHFQPVDRHKVNPVNNVIDWRNVQNNYIGQGIKGLSGMGQTKAQGTWFDMMNQMQAQQQDEQDLNDIIDQSAINQQQD